MDDRISALPQDVIHHILSFLSTKDIACLSVLSKPFKSAWTTLPELSFDASFFGGEGKKELLNFVDQTLRNRHTQEIGLSKLVIDLSSYDLKKVGNLVYRWIRYAVDCNVKEFELDGEYDEYYRRYIGWYDLPCHSSLFSAPSITMLTLRGRIDLLKCNIMKNLSLQNLFLKNVRLNDQTLHTLISSCPKLEYLKLKNCDGLKSLKIFGVSKLKTLYLTVESDFESVDIEAIHLESFVFSGRSTAWACDINLSSCVNLRKFGLFSIYMATKWLSDLLAKLPTTALKDLALDNCSLPHKILDVVSAFNNLTRLSLGTVTRLTSNWFQDLFSKCPLLEVLEVKCRNIEAEIIRISSCLLKKLSFGIWDQEKQVEVEIDTPNLRSFKFRGNLNLIYLFWKYDLVLSKANLEISYKETLTKTEFLAKFNRCQTLKLHDKHIIVPENERESFISPLFNVQHLKVRQYVILQRRRIMELVEGLLWFSPRPQTLSILFGSSTKLLKFIYEKGEDRKGTNCFCTSLPITCWRHCLKNIEFNNFTRNEVASLKNFFSEKVDDPTRLWLKDST